MMSSKNVSPAHLARLEKRKIASEEGAQALAEQEARAVAVRQNMERLKALRLAKEAEEAKRAPAPTAKRAKGAKAAKGKGGAKSSGGKQEGGKTQPLSAWLAAQRDSGRLR